MAITVKEPNVAIDVSAGGASVLVPAPAGPFAFLAVTGYNLLADGITVLTLEDTAGTVYDTSTLTPAGSGLVKVAQEGSDCFQLPKGLGLNLRQSGSARVTGSLQYRVIMR